VSTTLYAGGGHLIEPNNETNPTEYDSHREGIGAIGHWRMERGDLGPFVMVAGTFELESLTQTACPWGAIRATSSAAIIRKSSSLAASPLATASGTWSFGGSAAHSAR
jgi:hypothetical protein